MSFALQRTSVTYSSGVGLERHGDHLAQQVLRDRIEGVRPI